MRRLPLVIAACVLACADRAESPAAPTLRLCDRWAAAPTADVSRERVSLSKSQRDALVVAAGSEVGFAFTPLEHEVLRTSLGVRSEAEGPSVRFEVRLSEEGEAPQTLATWTVRAKPRSKTAPWREVTVNLARWVGEDVRLTLATDGESSTDAFWGAPILLSSREAVARPPDVLLISIDTLPAHRMSVYGAARRTTPQLERLAADGVVFEQAIAHQSWTLTSHASLLTSLYPDTHRVALGTAIADELPLLPAALKDNGWVTVGVANNMYLDPRFGYDRGYDAYDFDYVQLDPAGRIMRTIEEALPAVRPLLASTRPAPVFLFLHLIDAHSDWRERPYDAPAPYDELFMPARARAAPLSAGDLTGSVMLGEVNKGTVSLSERQVERFAALYDGGLAYTDHHLGVFLDELRAEGRYDDALIVVTSDHGEEFLEHGRTMHTQGYEECLRVPLIVKLPGGRWAGRRITEQVQLVDVFPTIVDVLGLDAGLPLEGHSLLDVIEGAAHPQPHAYAKGENFAMTPDDVYVLRTREWKLIWKPAEGTSELYHLASDPTESRDVASEHPARHAELMADLAAHRSRRDVGFRVRIPAYEGDAVVSGRITSEAGFVRVTEFDLNAVPADAPRFVLSEDGRRLDFTVHPDQRHRWYRPVGVDFDLANGTGELTLEVEVNGEPLGPGQLLVGPGREPVEERPLTLRAGGRGLHRGTEALAVDDRSERPQLLVWESRSAAVQDVELSEEERELLHALGYVGG